MSEAELYAPVKAFLEAQGFEVKGEIGACDVFALRGDEAPVVVELKQRLDLKLLLQAADRLRMTDAVYIAFRADGRGTGSWRTQRKSVIALLRRLGVGLLTVSAAGRVCTELDPGPYRPRSSAPRRERLLREFSRRVGDPETGGTPSRKRLTAYRQEAVLCARLLAEAGTLSVSEIRRRSDVAHAARILQRDPYGWFDRVRRGHYRLSPRGAREHAGFPP